MVNFRSLFNRRKKTSSTSISIQKLEQEIATAGPVSTISSWSTHGTPLSRFGTMQTDNGTEVHDFAIPNELHGLEETDGEGDIDMMINMMEVLTVSCSIWLPEGVTGTETLWSPSHSAPAAAQNPFADFKKNPPRTCPHCGKEFYNPFLPAESMCSCEQEIAMDFEIEPQFTVGVDSQEEENGSSSQGTISLKEPVSPVLPSDVETGSHHSGIIDSPQPPADAACHCVSAVDEDIPDSDAADFNKTPAESDSNSDAGYEACSESDEMKSDDAESWNVVDVSAALSPSYPALVTQQAPNDTPAAQSLLSLAPTLPSPDAFTSPSSSIKETHVNTAEGLCPRCFGSGHDPRDINSEDIVCTLCGGVGSLFESCLMDLCIEPSEEVPLHNIADSPPSDIDSVPERAAPLSNRIWACTGPLPCTSCTWKTRIEQLLCTTCGATGRESCHRCEGTGLENHRQGTIRLNIAHVCLRCWGRSVEPSPV